jgi:hypothetical protein
VFIFDQALSENRAKLSGTVHAKRTRGIEMSSPITLLQDASGGLWFKRFRIENITFNEVKKVGHLYGVDLIKKAPVVISICSKPMIKPIPDQDSAPAQPLNLDDFERKRRKRDQLLEWWRSKSRPF